MSFPKRPFLEEQETKSLQSLGDSESTWQQPTRLHVDGGSDSLSSTRLLEGDEGLLPTRLNHPLGVMVPAVPPPSQVREALLQRQKQELEPDRLTSTREMLWLEEAERAHHFGRVILVLCVLVVFTAPLLSLSAFALSLLMGAIFMLGATGAWVWLQTRDRRNYNHQMFRVFGLLAVLASFVIEYAVGVFSPAPVGIALGIAFFSLGDDRSWSIGLCVSAAFGYLVLGLLIFFGVIVDPSATNTNALSRGAQLFFLVMVPVCYVLVLGQARLSRRATHQAMVRLEEALRLAEKDRAQRHEIEQELEQAQRYRWVKEGPLSNQVLGPYELGTLLGRGAVGEVYAARRTHTQQPIALKILRHDVMDRDGLKDRFLQEGQMAVQLRSPHVIRVFEVGLLEAGLPYIAMEQLEGEALIRHLQDNNVMSLQDAVPFVAQIAEGLEAVHRAGIIHRDINPQNLFLDTRQKPPCWKLLDFSISKWMGAPSGQYTLHGLLGTPGYMSPEQAWNQPLSSTSDIFGLGAVLYRALTGKPPFASKSISEVLVNIILRQPSRPGEFVSLPRDVEYVLAIALAKRPEDRFQSATEFGKAFALAAHQKLPSVSRERAQKLLLQQPWGYEQEPPSWLFDKGES